MKPVLKAPGSMLLKLRYDGPLSNFAFNCNLRRYDSVDTSTFFLQFCLLRIAQSCPLELIHPPFHLGFVVKTMVGRCRLKPVFAPTEQDILRFGL